MLIDGELQYTAQAHCSTSNTPAPVVVGSATDGTVADMDRRAARDAFGLTDCPATSNSATTA